MKILKAPIVFTDVLPMHTSHYQIDGGNMYVTVVMNSAAYGYWSAVLVVEHNDSPMTVEQYDGYSNDIPTHLRAATCRAWVAGKLNSLAARWAVDGEPPMTIALMQGV